MKRMFIVLLLLPFISPAQKIKVNEFDKFIKQRRVESFPLTLKTGPDIKMDLTLIAIGPTYYVQLSGFGRGTNIINEEDKVIFLLDNDSTVTVKSTGLQSYDIGKIANSYKHDYVVTLADLEKLSQYNLQALRKYYRAKDFDDIYIPKENSDKVKKLSALFIQELKNEAAPAIVRNIPQPGKHTPKTVLAIDVNDLVKHIGDSVTVSGKIISGRYVTDSKGASTILSVGAAAPHPLFTVIIRGADRMNFDPEPEKMYQGKQARITGRVELYNGKLQIPISRKEQLEIIDTVSLADVKSNPPAPPPVQKEEVVKKPTIALAPAFPGGRDVLMNFLNRNLKPPVELAAGEEKTVTVQFLVTADGTASDFKITQSAGAAFDNEVLRVLKRMPKWKPALENGHPVDAVVTQPVTFFRAHATTKRTQQ